MMKSVLLSTSVAAAIGALTMGAASAAPIATHGVVLAPSATTDVACRTVQKTVFRNGVKRVTTTRDCGPGPRYGYGPRPAYGYVERRRVYGARPYYRPARPGLSIRVN